MNRYISVLIAVLASAILTPILGKLLSRMFPPAAQNGVRTASSQTSGRNRRIELAGVLFFVCGASIPFLIAGTSKLQASISNIGLILSSGILFMIGGIALVCRVLGKDGAASFLEYFETERKIGRAGLLLLSKLLAMIALFTLVVIGLSRTSL